LQWTDSTYHTAHSLLFLPDENHPVWKPLLPTTLACLSVTFRPRSCADHGHKGTHANTRSLLSRTHAFCRVGRGNKKKLLSSVFSPFPRNRKILISSYIISRLFLQGHEAQHDTTSGPCLQTYTILHCTALPRILPFFIPIMNVIIGPTGRV
jgi:hypothetical protein